MKTLTILAVIGLAAPALRAADVVPVPSPGLPDAVLAPAAKQDGSAETWVAKGADGARAVVCGGALVTAVLGARLHADCGGATDEAPGRIRLVSGGFHLHVGSAPLHVILGETTLEARSSELIAARLKDDWIVQIKPLDDTGGVAVLPPATPVEAEPPATADPTDDAAEQPPATPAPPPAPLALEPGKRFVIGAGADPAEASRRGRMFLGKMVTRLVPSDQAATGRGPLLSARDVESPADFAIDAAAATGAMTDVEIEGIEVEVGCVEICVD